MPAVADRNEGAPSNNGMKLTARGARDEARQLIPVFYGQEPLGATHGV